METGKPTVAMDLAKRVLEAEAAALVRMAGSLGAEYLQALDLMANCKGKVIFTGVGKSGLVARKMAATASSLGTPSMFLHSGDAVHGDSGVMRPEDVVVAISHSGETGEVLALLPIIRKVGCRLISITRDGRNTLAGEADVSLRTAVESEADPRGLAPTTSSTATMALGDAIALCLADMKGFGREDFRRFHPGGSLGASVSSSMVHGRESARG